MNYSLLINTLYCHRQCIGNVINRLLYGFKFMHNDRRFIDFQLKLRQVLDLIGVSGLLMTFRVLRHIPCMLCLKYTQLYLSP